MSQSQTEGVSSAAAAGGPRAAERSGGRLVSLDVFRGATMAAMVLVNNPGSGSYVYGPLQHAEWDGWTFTDTIFPSFVWIVGVAMTLSFAKRTGQGADKVKLFLHALRRAAIIFALGLFIYGFPHFDLSTQRILGVLQRIAICYLVATAIFLTGRIRGQIAWTVFFLASYWVLMKFVPVPGYGAGYMDLERNFAHYIDRMVLGVHNYVRTDQWDPEGIVSTLPAIATALFGILTGHILRMKRSIAEKAAWVFLLGNCLICTGLILNVWMPINKKLWTTSFAVFMAGLSTVAFAICYWLVDGNGYKRWAKPAIIFGMNSITIYFFSEILDITLQEIRFAGPGGQQIRLKEWIFQHIFSPVASPINASLLYAIAYVLVCLSLGWFMYRRKWFVRF